MDNQNSHNKRNKKADEKPHNDDPVMDDSDCDDEDMDMLEYRKFLNTLFPSKNMKKKIKDTKKLNELVKKTNSSKNDDSEKSSKKDKNKKSSKPDAENKKITEEQTDSEDSDYVYESTEDSSYVDEENNEDEIDIEETDDEEDIEETDDEDDEDDIDTEDEEEIREMLRENMKFNIVFTIGKPQENEDEDDEEGEEEEPDTESDEEETIEKVEKPRKKMRVVKKKKKQEDDENEDSDEEDKPVKSKRRSKRLQKKQELQKETEKTPKSNTKHKKSKRDKHCEENDEFDEDTQTAFKSLLQKFKSVKNAPEDMFESLEKYMEKQKEKQVEKDKAKIKKQKEQNSKKFKKQLRGKKKVNEMTYFKNLDIEKQQKILEELKEMESYLYVDKPYRIKLIESPIPAKYKANAMRKINALRYMEPGSGEYYKVKQWVDTFMQIPFGVNYSLPLQISDGVEKCHDFMENAKKTLDDAVFGLDDAKMQIMQLMGQWISNPDAVGTAIAIKGPMGTGKTTLVKEGISKILGRPFAFIALGGATDSSFLEGHSYTYEGSIWGQIVDILIKSKCMNPVIYFDELDKISDTAKGEEIAGILTHLTDTSQNSAFHDKYFAGVDLDLSKALFIFSYNHEHKVNPILRDRMYRINTEGYDCKQKIKIAKDYLIPSIERNVNFEPGQITFENGALNYIISNLTDKEKGVRNFKRCIEIIYTKLNLYRLMKPDTTLFDKEETLKVEFPFNVTEEIVRKLIKKTDDDTFPSHLYM